MSVFTSSLFLSTQSLKICAAPVFVAPCAAPHTQLAHLGQEFVGGGTEVLVCVLGVEGGGGDLLEADGRLGDGRLGE